MAVSVFSMHEVWLIINFGQIDPQTARRFSRCFCSLSFARNPLTPGGDLKSQRTRLVAIETVLGFFSVGIISLMCHGGLARTLHVVIASHRGIIKDLCFFFLCL